MCLKKCTAFFFVLVILCAQLADAAVVRKSSYTGLNSFFQISLHDKDVEAYLPRNGLRLHGSADRYLEKFSPMKKVRDELEGSMRYMGDLSGKKILKLLKSGVVYSCVLTGGDVLVLAEKGSGMRSMYAKHYYLANYANAVTFAGECWLDAASSSTLVVNNSSGSYRPSVEDLAAVQRLLADTLRINVEKVVFQP